MPKVKMVRGICGGCRKLMKLIDREPPPAMCRKCHSFRVKRRKLLSLNDWEFVAWLRAHYKGSWTFPKKSCSNLWNRREHVRLVEALERVGERAY